LDYGPIVGAAILAYVDLHDARIGSALARLEGAPFFGMHLMIRLARLTGDLDVRATRWATRFVSLPEDSGEVRFQVESVEDPIILCLSARRELRMRCLDRVAVLGHRHANRWRDGTEEVLVGAQRYAVGDVKGAIVAWRSVLARSSDYVVGLLPTEVFEAAGERDLAARVDARKLEHNEFGPIEAVPREARRALARGDKERARALAEEFIKAWEVADITIPGVAEMRDLLRSLPRR
jgi:hypothetical protein